jgi:E3 ubiquitin-protein ligase CCNP1IP1
MVSRHIICRSCLSTDCIVYSGGCNSDDIVVTNLKPSESYKNTILAGMEPAVIVEIARRAFGVWNYQVSMESEFQRLMLKDAQEVNPHLSSLIRSGHTVLSAQRASIMERDINNIVREANTKVARASDPSSFAEPTPSLSNLLVTDLDEKILQIQKELDHSLRKNQDLSDANKQTSKEYTKLRAQYDKLLGKTMPASVSRGRGNTSHAGSAGALLGKQQQQIIFGQSEQQEGMGEHANMTTSIIQVCIPRGMVTEDFADG